MTTRVSPPANSKVGVNPITVNAASGNVGGRTYSVAVGSTVDVPDHDAAQMILNGWHSHGLVTTTAGRPALSSGANPVQIKGVPIIDSTLGAVIIFDGGQWRNFLTGAIV